MELIDFTFVPGEDTHYGFALLAQTRNRCSQGRGLAPWGTDGSPQWPHLCRMG
jgi:hypothetical protein